MPNPWPRRVAPALGLFFIAPLVAEFLLGDLPLNLLGALVILAPMYGGGALLIREVVRRTGRGWPSIFVLAFAYSIFEEAFTTQTLFNPNYLHLNLHLLAPAYIPALGIGIWWTIFVLTLHTVWSISTSIALTEALVPDRATTPWLGWPGLTITAILFALAAVVSTKIAIKQDHFIASTRQFVVSAVACIVVIAAAFRLPRRSSPLTEGWVANPWLVGAGALAAGSIFLIVPNGWGWWAVVLYLLLDSAVIAAVFVLSHRTGWDARHRLALAAGAALAYAWHAFIQTPAVGGSHSLRMIRIGNAIFAAALLILLYIAARRTMSQVTQGTQI
ncbi:MAG: hypothetical protein WAN60_01485 [Candidatus Sulfotelmatobacter sp.]